MSVPVFISIGSNIDPEKNLNTAAKRLRDAYSEIEFSSVYKTAPQLEEDQDAFLNAVARIETGEPVKTIHETLKRIESELKKDPPYRFGPRTIDLDILLYGNDVIDEEDLQVPHPRMHERRFVLEPLRELIDSDQSPPNRPESWRELLKMTTHQPCKQIEMKL